MLSNEVITSINNQINKEFYSSYLYLQISDYFASYNLNGFSNWFMVQAQEEQAHALLFLKYLQNNGTPVLFQDIQATSISYETFKEALVATFEHELTVTQSIHDIYATALEQRDFRTTEFLQWFIKEQGEEEKNTEELIKKYTLFGQDGKGLYLLDSELAARVYVAPSLVI